MISLANFFQALPHRSYRHIAQWAHYFKGAASWLQSPELCFTHLAQYLPHTITAVIDVGCGNGRNFLPFQQRYHCYGIDIAPEEQIFWLQQLIRDRIIYRAMTIQDIVPLLEQSTVDLSSTLVVSSGTLMYLQAVDQRRFFNVLRARGCNNFIFQEHTSFHGKQHVYDFALDKSFFIEKAYRMIVGLREPKTFIHLDVDPATEAQLRAYRTVPLSVACRRAIGNVIRSFPFGARLLLRLRVLFAHLYNFFIN